MNQAQYIKWVATRSNDATKWERSKCYAADALIKDVALKAYKAWSKANIHPKARVLLDGLISIHFGSVEVDEFLQSINAYPDWV